MCKADEEASAPGPDDLPLYLTHVVSSQLDADRCDYLLRDSHATGTNYGNYDLSWLLAQLCLQVDGNRFYQSRKALSAAEAYLFARSHMYRAVYFHKTTRAAEVMLRLLFQRFKELLDSAGSEGARRAVVPEAHPRMIAAFTGQMSLAEYLDLDDHSITELLKACTGAPDLIVRNLSAGLLNRQLFKAVDVSGVSSAEVAEFRVNVERLLPRDWLPRYSFVVDTPKDTPYKPYDPDADKPATQIYVETANGERKEISQLSDTVKELRRQYELVRYYFPEEIRGKVDAVAAETVRRGKA